MLTKRQSDGRGKFFLAQNVKELSNVIAMKTHGNSDNNTQNPTMGVAESHVSIGSDPRNMVLKLKKEPVRQEFSQMYAPGLAEAVPGRIPNKVPVDKTIFGTPTL